MSRQALDDLRDVQVAVMMDWPSKSPDLNPMETLWGIVVRDVYASGRQYDSREQLATAILTAWKRNPAAAVETLIESSDSMEAKLSVSEVSCLCKAYHHDYQCAELKSIKSIK